MTEKRHMFAVEKGLVALDSIVHVLSGHTGIANRRFGDWFVTDHDAKLPDGIRLADTLGVAHRVSSRYAPAVLAHIEVEAACEQPFSAPAANHIALLPRHHGEAPTPAPEGITRLTETVRASRDPKMAKDTGEAWVYYGAEPFEVRTATEVAASHPVHRA